MLQINLVIFKGITRTYNTRKAQTHQMEADFFHLSKHKRE